MINIEITQEELMRPEVYSAMLRLLEAMNGTTPMISSAEPSPVRKRVNARRASEQVGTPYIDEEVRASYQDTISKAKSLFFLSTIKNLGVADSDQIVKAMEAHYPNFTRKSIGGITGAIRRWFDNKGAVLPYTAEPDRSRNGIHIFTWVEMAKLSTADINDLKSRINSKFHSKFNKLIREGSISKGDFAAKTQDWSKFVLDISKLGTSHFENEGDKLIYRSAR